MTPTSGPAPRTPTPHGGGRAARARPAAALLTSAAILSGCLGTSESYTLSITSSGDADVRWERTVDMDSALQTIEDAVRTSMSQQNVPSYLRFQVESIFHDGERRLLMEALVENATENSARCDELGAFSIRRSDGIAADLPVAWGTVLPEVRAEGTQLTLSCSGGLEARQVEEVGLGTMRRRDLSFEVERTEDGDIASRLVDDAYREIKEGMVGPGAAAPGLDMQLDSLLLECEDSDLNSCTTLLETLEELLESIPAADLLPVAVYLAEYADRASSAAFYSVLEGARPGIESALEDSMRAGTWLLSIGAPGKARTSSGTVSEAGGVSTVSWTLPHSAGGATIDATWGRPRILSILLRAGGAALVLAGVAAAALTIRSRRPRADETPVWPSDRPLPGAESSSSRTLDGQDRQSIEPVPHTQTRQPQQTQRTSSNIPEAPAGPPPGWYKDPAPGSTGQRYWTGTAWTGHTRT